MYIRKIIINNITSLKGEHVIDFTAEPLRSADLFAITGDTGAGKSTILDCICLALYNKAPRFSVKENNKSSLKLEQQLHNYDTRNVLRRGETKGSCAVEFYTREGIFVATWSVRVKSTGTFDPVSRSLEQTSPKHRTFEPREVQDEIRRLVGLDYEQFTRTVILAQNSFANFLRARRDEKSKLLEKLTGTEIYNKISSMVYEQNQKAQADYLLKLSEFEHFKNETLDETMLAECINRKTLVESQLKLLADRIDYLNRQLAWYDTYEDLEKKTREATDAFNEANRTNVGMTQKRERLQRFDDVAEVRDRVVSVMIGEKSIADIQRNIDALSQEISSRNRERSDAAAKFDEARMAFSKCESTLRQQEPLFRKGRDVLRQIDISENTRKERTSDLEQTRKENSDIERRIDDSRKSLAVLEKQLEACKVTMQSLLPHQAMLDQYGSVLEKVRSYSSLLSDSDTMRKRQAAITAELESLKSQIEKISGEIDTLTQKKDSLDQSRAQLQNSSLGIDGTMLQQGYNNAFTLQTKLQGAKRLWESLAAEYEENDRNENLISSLGITIENRKGQLHDLELETTKCKQIFEIHEKYFNMGQTDNVKELRKNLCEGEPCPVCGATHHPYHSESEQRLNEVVSNAEKACDEAREKYNASEEKFNSLKAMQNTDTEKHRSLLEKRQEIARRVERDRNEWEQQYAALDKTFADSSEKVNAMARRVMIVQLLENADKTAREMQARLAEFNKCRAEIERYTLEIEEVANKIVELQGKRSEMLMTKGVHEGNRASIDESLKSNSDSAHEIYIDLEKTLTVADWRQLIRTNPKQLRDNITEFHTRWSECSAAMQKIEESRAEVETYIRNLESTQQKNNAKARELSNRIEEIEQLISSQRNDIYRMFGDANPIEAEDTVRTQLEEARKEMDLRTEALHAAQQALGTVSAQCRQAKEEQKRLENERLETSTEIDKWISAFNQSHSAVRYNELVEIFNSPCDWNALRAEVKSAENAYALASDRMKAAQAALTSWQSRPEHPDRATETRQYIASSIYGIELKQKESNSELEKVKEKLAFHEHGMAKMNELKAGLGEMEKNAREWAQLNSLIGSANGMLFSRYAQNTTLRLLVEHANAQLALFSPRYRLRKTEEVLDLEIIDQFMSDEHRPVSSLSGGETFVVSLALALGLASLSNRRLSIGSLFIDEGFGNLDNESLDMVIRALGNLNAQGRKVGIISHTRQIRDNIFPQIQVVRKNAADSLSAIKTVSF